MDHSAETEREFSAKGTDALGKGVKNWGETESTHTIRGICNTIRFDDLSALPYLYRMSFGGCFVRVEGE